MFDYESGSSDYKSYCDAQAESDNCDSWQVVIWLISQVATSL